MVIKNFFIDNKLFITLAVTLSFIITFKFGKAVGEFVYWATH